MPPEILDEREFELVNIIGADLTASQRDLSRRMDLSLGMINMLVRRLIAKGIIRINQLNKRKVEYILTSHGFAEKMRKSVKYTLKTINSISAIKKSLKDKLDPIIQEGERDFAILGGSDFAVLVEIVLKELCGNEYRVSYVQDIGQRTRGVLLICREEVAADQLKDAGKSINLVEELAKDLVVSKV